MSLEKKLKNDWLESQIFQILNENTGAKMNYKQLSSRLGFYNKDERKTINLILNSMVNNKKIIEQPLGSFYVEKKTGKTEGVIEINKRGAGFLILENENDIHISPSLTYPALSGDTVLVEIIKTGRKTKPEGKVLKVIKRKKELFSGIVQVSNGFGFFVPDDASLNTDFFIPKNKLKGAKNNDRAVAKLINWPQTSNNPYVEIVKILGKSGENNAEINAILYEYGLKTDFPESVIAESQNINETITETEIKKRNDFRNKLTFTIDPEDAKDFDDAISFVKLNDKIFEIGIHIADVSHFVTENSELDKEALSRATSVYLVDRVVPMLPENLSNNICSLRPDVDRLCFSAVFELDIKGKIHKEWFGKTVIHSNKRFSYEEAQNNIEKNEGLYAQELIILNKIAKNLKNERLRQGAISFETEEIKFLLDKNAKPVKVLKKVRKDAHKLIEEFMLLANKRVATTVNKNYKPYTIPYRLHEPPIPSKMQEFADVASRFGYKINTTNEDEYIKSINEMIEATDGTKFSGILQPLAIKSMEKAFYTSQKTGHFGLGFDYYAHFTSPIRRYPDLLTHRYFILMIEQKFPIHQENIEQTCNWCSKREQLAVDAERTSVKFKQTEYLSNYIGDEFEGIISGITSWGIFVELVENKCEGMVRIKDMKDDIYEFYEKGKFVMGRRKKIKYSIGDNVSIKVKKTNITKRTIDFELVF
ncbi:MAG: ribonuclease R [Bacteroidetes bacterium]|nr:ribonuclease R [Bacteroidota bacterium]